MYCKVNGADIQGIRARMIQVEADVTDGLPVFHMVGVLSSAVKEARERVHISLKSLGIRFPAKRITVNLSPADVRKDGTYFDLPIAISLLAAFGHIDTQILQEYIIVGELSLNGEVKGVRGMLAIVMEAYEQGIRKCILPEENVKEASAIRGMELVPIRSLRQVYDFLRGELINPFIREKHGSVENEHTSRNLLCPDFKDVIGQEASKRAMAIAASGMHNILLMGPPGTGKTMLARCITGILPKLSYEEQIEITKIYSICGLSKPSEGLIRQRPFRAPHHTITTSALAGGGRNGVPGEITLASGGVLFLDEFLEFSRANIELLRQPLEDRKITVSRLANHDTYPADIMLVAACNPCRCGYFPDMERCTCSPSDVANYINRLSEPILDRMDLCTQTTQQTEFLQDKKEMSSHELRLVVEKARKMQQRRYHEEHIHFNAQLSVGMLNQYCQLGKEEKSFLENLLLYHHISTRGIHRIIKVARTIADMEEKEQIEMEHLCEAVRFRGFEKNNGEMG